MTTTDFRKAKSKHPFFQKLLSAFREFFSKSSLNWGERFLRNFGAKPRLFYLLYRFQRVVFAEKHQLIVRQDLVVGARYGGDVALPLDGNDVDLIFRPEVQLPEGLSDPVFRREDLGDAVVP